MRIWYRPVTWSVSDTMVATIVSTGPTTAQIRGRAPGPLVVTGTVGGVSASRRITVR